MKLILIISLLLSLGAYANEPKTKPVPTPEAKPDTKADDLSIPAPLLMTNKRMEKLIKRIDPGVEGEPGRWRLVYESMELFIITDENADRMRIITPITKAKKLDNDVLVRMMQANFDAALDSRYAIANGLVWGVFIHPLSSLTDRDLFSGMAQTLSVRKTFGTTYSSGVMVFRNGDSEAEQRKFYEQLLRKGNVI